MKNLRIIPIALLWLGSTAFAQSGDWEAVRALPAGTIIKVTLRLRPTFGHCALEEVTDDGFSCYSRTSGERQFAKEEIRAIYVAHNTKLAGFEIGTSIGALDGAAKSPSNGLGRGGDAILGGLLLGGLGMAIGAAAGPFFDGKAVYRSGDGKPRKTAPSTSSGPVRRRIP